MTSAAARTSPPWAAALGHTFTIVMFTQKFVDETGYTSLEEVIADRYPIKLITKKNGSLGELTASA